MKKFAAAILAGVAMSFAFSAVAVAKDKTIAVSWKTFQEERWKTDEAAIKAVVEAAGDKYISTDAQGSAQKQAADIEGLITQKVDVILVVAFDSDAILPSFQAVSDAGVKMISYDVLVEDPNALYVTFDNVGVGRLMAKEMLRRASPKATTPSSRATRAIRTPPSCSRASRKCSRKRWMPARSRTSARPSPTAGSRTMPRRTWSSA